MTVALKKPNYTKPNLNGDLFPDPLFCSPAITVSPAVDVTVRGSRLDLQIGDANYPLYVENLEELRSKIEAKYTGAHITASTLLAIQSDTVQAIQRGRAYFDYSSPLAQLRTTATTSFLGGTVDFFPTGTWTTTTTGTVDFIIRDGHIVSPDKIWHFKQKMKTNLLIKVKTRTKPLNPSVSPAEILARNSLRDLITEAEYRRYLTNGFIMVKGQSGRFYQIFNTSHERIKVYYKNELTHLICIHTDNSVPSTDHVINMKMLIDLDETMIWKAGNVTVFRPFSSFRVDDNPTFAVDGRENFALAC